MRVPRVTTALALSAALLLVAPGAGAAYALDAPPGDGRVVRDPGPPDQKPPRGGNGSVLPPRGPGVKGPELPDPTVDPVPLPIPVVTDPVPEPRPSTPAPLPPADPAPPTALPTTPAATPDQPVEEPAPSEDAPSTTTPADDPAESSAEDPAEDSSMDTAVAPGGAGSGSGGAPAGVVPETQRTTAPSPVPATTGSLTTPPPDTATTGTPTAPPVAEDSGPGAQLASLKPSARYIAAGVLSIVAVVLALAIAVVAQPRRPRRTH